MLCQRPKFHEGFLSCKQSLLTHSHQNAYCRRKRNAKQLASIDAIFIIDAQDLSLVRESQDNRFRFTPAETKIGLQFCNELPVLDGNNLDLRLIHSLFN